MLSAFRRGSLRQSCASSSFNVEALENRRLLSGSISGTVRDDAVNTFSGATHAPVGDVRVYLDLQNSDTFVAGDPVAVTNKRGHYTFGGLSAGHYLVRPVPVSGRFTSTPSVGGSYAVDLAAGQAVAGEDFGLTTYTVSAAQPDGKVVASTPEDVSHPVLLWRVNPDGSLDSGFGDGGVVTLAPATGGAITSQPTPQQIAVRPDGYLLVLLTRSGLGTSSALSVLTPSGGFTGGGFNLDGNLGSPPPVGQIAFLPGGGLIGAGNFRDFSDNTGESLLVTRFNSDYTPDPTFGTNGQVRIDSIVGVPGGIAPLADGRIAVSYPTESVTLSGSGEVESAVRFKHVHVPTGISLSSSSMTAVMGTFVTLAARVRAAGGVLPVGYTVQFRSGAAVLGNAVASPTGHAVLAVNTLYGTVGVTATLLGSHHYAASESKPAAITVRVPPTRRMPGGLRAATAIEGTGSGVVVGRYIGIRYDGYLVDGTPVESNGRYVTLGSTDLIAGLNQGVLGMKVGETRVLFIPAALGYGPQPHGSVPADSELVYIVTLFYIVPL